MDALVRLTWALPLVLVIGLVGVFVARHLAGVRPPKPGSKARRLRLCESIDLDGNARVSLIEVDGRPYLIIGFGAVCSVAPMEPRTAAPRQVWGGLWAPKAGAR